MGIGKREIRQSAAGRKMNIAAACPSESGGNSREDWVFKSVPKLLCAFFMCQKAANNLLYLAVLTSLLDKAGANALPWVYLLVNVIFIGIQFRVMTRLAGREGHWLLRVLSLPAALMAFVAAWFFPTDMVPVLTGFFILTMLLDLTTNQGFTAMLNHFISINESKRVLPMIYAAGSFGFILSGLLLKFAIDFFGIRGLLVLNGLTVLAGLAFLRFLQPVEDRRLQEQKKSEALSGDNAQTADASVPSMRHPLASLLIISSFVIIFNKYLVDFLFAASLSSFFPVSNDLASFMGVFGATADFAVIGLQTFAMHRVFARFPIGRVLTFMPLVLTVLCGYAAFSLKFAVVAMVQFLVLLNSKNFTVPATTIFMGVIPQHDRVFYRRDMSIACSLSSAVVGGFLLLARNRVGYDALFFLAAILYLVMAWVHSLLDTAYLKTLRRSIVSRSQSESDDQLASLQYVQLAERCEQLRALLEDPDAGMRLQAINAAASLPEKYAMELLMPLLASERDGRCLTAVARNLLTIAPEEAGRHIATLLAATEDNRLRADIIEALGKIRHGEISAEQITVWLEHQHHRVVASAVISLVRLGRQRATIEAAMHRLADMAVSSAEMMRASAAAVMGELGLPLFVPALENLAAEDNLVVAGNAANALSRIQTPAAMAVLEKMLLHSNREIAGRAGELLETVSRENISRVSRLMSGITAEERRLLSARLRAGARQDNLELLAAILCIEHIDKRRTLINMLEKADAETQLLMSRCIIEVAEGQVELTVAPLIARLRQEPVQETVPVWFPLLGAIAGGTVEKPEMSPNLLCPLSALLTSLWNETAAVVANSACRVEHKLWQKYLRWQVQAFAFFSLEPAAILKSFDAIAGSNAHERGMALEYLETRAGRKLAQKVVPLIDPAAGLPSDVAAFSAFAAARDIEISAEMVADATTRLKQLGIILTDV